METCGVPSLDVPTLPLRPATTKRPPPARPLEATARIGDGGRFILGGMLTDPFILIGNQVSCTRYESNNALIQASSATPGTGSTADANYDTRHVPGANTGPGQPGQPSPVAAALSLAQVPCECYAAAGRSTPLCSVNSGATFHGRPSGNVPRHSQQPASRFLSLAAMGLTALDSLERWMPPDS